MVTTEKNWLSDEEIREFRLSGASTEDKVVRMRHIYRTIPPVEIAKVLGISREWARKLLERNGLPTNLLRLGKFCPECSKRLERLPKRGMCRECYSLKSKVAVDCSGCLIPMHVARPLYNRAMTNTRYKGNFYCSRDCFDQNKGPYQKHSKEVIYTHTCMTCSKEEEVYGSYEKRKAMNRKYCRDCRLALYNEFNTFNVPRMVRDTTEAHA